jgi:hypothetical protein
MTSTISRRELERRLRDTFQRHAESSDASHAEFDDTHPTRFDDAMSEPRSTRLVPAAVAILTVVGLIASAVLVFERSRDPSTPATRSTPAKDREAPARSKRDRLVPSDRSVLPGQVLTMTVHRPVAATWGGGVDSYFERRRQDGSWQRLYMLLWYGRGEPYVDHPNRGVDDLGVPATPFKVVIPAVDPGVYRVSRRFLTSPGRTTVEKTLTARVRVKRCPDGGRPTFVKDPAAPTRGLGTPACR